MSAPDPLDPFAAIPILLEPVTDDDATPEVVPVGEPDRSTLAAGLPVSASGVQHSLFEELPSPMRAPTRRQPGSAIRRRAADVLRDRAPAIVDELVAAHADRLTVALRERLRNEFERILAEIAADDPEEASPERSPSLPGDAD